MVDAKPIGKYGETGVYAELPAHAPLSCGTQLSSQHRVTAEYGDHVRQCLRVFGWHEASGLAVDDQFRDGRRFACDARQTLALGFHQDIRQAVSIAALGDAARENEEVCFAIKFQHRFLCERAAEIDAITDVKVIRHGVQLGRQSATANMDKPPVDCAGNAR